MSCEPLVCWCVNPQHSSVHRAKDERVDWLYSGPGTVNREEYLLGKRIDKLVDPTLAEEEREEQVGSTASLL